MCLETAYSLFLLISAQMILLEASSESLLISSQTQIESKKQQVEATFERLKQELGDQRHLLMTRLEGLEQQIWKEREEYITKVSQEVHRLGAQVEELEEKCQQPASELLQVSDAPQSYHPVGQQTFHKKGGTVLELGGDRERQEKEMGIISAEKGWGRVCFLWPKRLEISQGMHEDLVTMTRIRQS